MMRVIYAPGTVRRNLDGHKILGLAVAAILYLICLSGTLTVFYSAMEQWETAAVPHLTAAGSRAVAAAVMEARAHAPTPGAEVGAGLPTPDYPRLVVALNEDHRAYDASGRYAGPANHPIVEALTDLHYSLHLPSTIGLIVVGLGGLVLVSLAVGGVLAHPRLFKDAFLWRWACGPRLSRTDLHNRIGVWAMPFHLAIAITGALIGLGNVFILTVALTFHGGDTTRAAAPLLGPAALSAKEGRVGAGAIARALDVTRAHGTPYYLTINNPGTERESITTYVEVPDRLAYGEAYEFDSRGRLQARHHLLDGPAGRQVYASLYKLHFGSFGGVWTLWAYTLLGLGLCLICTTGMDIWLLKSAQRGRPHPRLQGAWRAFVWGAPAAMALAALFTLLLGWDFRPVFWGLLVLAAAAGGYGTALPVARACRLLLAGGLILLVGAQLGSVGARGLSGASLAVNAVLLIVAAAIWLGDLCGLFQPERPKPEYRP